MDAPSPSPFPELLVALAVVTAIAILVKAQEYGAAAVIFSSGLGYGIARICQLLKRR